MNSIAHIKEMPNEVIDTLLKRRGAQHPKEALKGIAFGGERMIEILTPILLHQALGDKPAMKGQQNMHPQEYLKQKHILCKQTTSDMMRTLGLNAMSCADEIKMDIKTKLVDALFGSEEAWKYLIEREKKASAPSITDVFQLSRKELLNLSFAAISAIIEDIDDVYDLKRDTKVISQSALTDAIKKKCIKQLLLHRFQKDVVKREDTTIEEIMESCQTTSSSGSDGDTPGPSRAKKSPKRKFTQLCEDDDLEHISKKKDTVSLLATEIERVDSVMAGLHNAVHGGSVQMAAIHLHILQLLEKDPTAWTTKSDMALTGDMFQWLGRQLVETIVKKVQEPDTPDKSQPEAQPETPC
jgi:hypothetical protein